MTSLRTLTEQYAELQALAEQGDEGMEVAIRDTMQAIEGEFNEKAQALITVVHNMDSDVDALEREIARLTDRKKAIKARQDSMREWLRQNMEETGITSIKCPLFSITLAKGVEVAVIDQESALPDECVSVQTTIKPDKREILRRLKAGEDVPGAHIERGQSSVRIK